MGSSSDFEQVLSVYNPQPAGPVTLEVKSRTQGCGDVILRASSVSAVTLGARPIQCAGLDVCLPTFMLYFRTNAHQSGQCWLTTHELCQICVRVFGCVRIDMPRTLGVPPT